MLIKSAVMTHFNKAVTVGIDGLGRTVIFKSDRYDNKGNFTGAAIYWEDREVFYYAGYNSNIDITLTDKQKKEIQDCIKIIASI